MSTSPQWRTAERIVAAEPASDGAGVKLNRSISTPALPDLDPFLMLDEFNTENPDDYIAGFPEHPHRGFETVTYMIDGNMRHRDNTGAEGVLRGGGVQWMTAGRGILHSEMPEQVDGRMQGFQLWVNLPARLKMTDPRYQEFDGAGVPEVRQEDGALIRVVAGAHGDISGPVEGIHGTPLYLDVTLPTGAAVTQPVESGHNGFVYVFEGDAVEITGAESGNGDLNDRSTNSVPRRHLAVLSSGDCVSLRNSGDKTARLLLVAGAPIGEPIARYGPFVMNTEQEIHQAFKDFQDGNFV